jgi:hypothetical protein
MFADGVPVGVLLDVGDPVGAGLDEVLTDGPGLGDDEVLGDGLDEGTGLPLADWMGAPEPVRQLGEVCGDALRAGLLDPPPPGCEL